MSKIIDLTGQIFGNLTVIERTDNPNNKKKCRFWRCLCVCGSESIVSTTDLTSGKTSQCWNCAHKASGMHKRIDVVGKKYGLLTVDTVEYGIKDKSGRERTYCNCICDCGNTARVLLDTLRSDGLHSCGCGRKITADMYLANDVVGNKYGRLTIKREFKELTPRRVLCTCDCGNEVIVVKNDVISGHTQSCGCLQKERTSEANEKDWYGQVNEFGVMLIEQYQKNEHGTWLWNCKCPCCGNIFIALPANVVSNKITSCGCRAESSGEAFIANVLDEINVPYISQYRFSDCKDAAPLPFDFAILAPKELVLLEYDGRQHFEAIDFFGGQQAFELRKFHDSIKEEYCRTNNIKFIRVPFTYSYDEIKELLINITQP